MATIDHEIKSVSTIQAPSATSPHTNTQSQGIEALKDIAFGSTAGVLGKFVEYPFDTIKVRLQSQNISPQATLLNGPLDGFRAAFRAPEGPLLSLYRGISAPLLGAAIETSSLFFSYRVAQDILVRTLPSLCEHTDDRGKVVLPFGALLACGGASGAFTSLLLTPIELIKCKMQVPITPSHLASASGYPNPRPLGALQLISSIFKMHGLLGFWHGQLGTLIRETGGSAAWFGSYEGLKIIFLHYDRRLQNADDLKLWQQMISGAAAGMTYNFVFYPADTIKSRMQTEEMSASMRKSNFFTTGRELWHQQGVRGFYRGCGITVFRAAPSSAIIFSIFEGLRRYFE
jgi:mitochondrial ornithine carrier protein